MRLGELPKNVSRLIHMDTETSHVRFHCAVCGWTTAITTTHAGAAQISPDHACPETRHHQLGHKPIVVESLSIDPMRYTPEAEIRERERRANEQEFGFTTVKFPHGGSGRSEVM